MTDETYDLAALAMAEINAICQGVRKWTMSIPVRETDSDVLFGRLAVRVRELEAAALTASEATKLLEVIDRATLSQNDLRKLVAVLDTLRRIAHPEPQERLNG